MEAKRHLEAEDGRDSITALQASLEFVYHYFCVGQDKLGEKYLYDSMRLANNLGFFKKSQGELVYDARMEHVRYLTAWHTFENVT